MHPVFPLIAIAVAWTFAWQLGRQWMDRRRDHALAWAFSLFLFGLGHVAVLVGLTAGWSEPAFGIYWLSGALLTVPLLAIGQHHLGGCRGWLDSSRVEIDNMRLRRPLGWTGPSRTGPP